MAYQQIFAEQIIPFLTADQIRVQAFALKQDLCAMNVSRVVVFQVTGPAPGSGLYVRVIIGYSGPANAEGDCGGVDEWMGGSFRRASGGVFVYGGERVIGGEKRRDGCLT